MLYIKGVIMIDFC